MELAFVSSEDFLVLRWTLGVERELWGFWLATVVCINGMYRECIMVFHCMNSSVLVGLF